MRRTASIFRISLPWLAAIVLSASLVSVTAQNRHREHLFFPDIIGYLTLKCDFHMHTVFSDGEVWPTIRVEEAWRDGLDVIALTDHVEYQPHKDDLGAKYGRSHELAKGLARTLGLLLVQAAEITRDEPPGHLNALFLRDIQALKQKDYLDAVEAAVAQGAFLYWNHPGWKQPNGKSVWYAEQGHLLTSGWLHGLEVVNGADYDPIVHQWGLDKKLTLMGGSDVHELTGWDYDRDREQHRPVTLVFAKAKTEESLREALMARRTAIFTTNQVLGDAEFLLPLFLGSIEVKSNPLRLKADTDGFVQIYNRSPVTFVLEPDAKLDQLSLPKSVRLRSGKVSLLRVKAKTNVTPGQAQLALPFRVVNLRTSPKGSLRAQIPVTLEFGK